MRISDWSSDVCSSDLDVKSSVEDGFPEIQIRFDQERAAALGLTTRDIADQVVRKVRGEVATRYSFRDRKIDVLVRAREQDRASVDDIRSEEHMSELQSLMRRSYAGFCLKKKKK